MAEGKCATCARYVLVIFNLLFWIIGILLMGTGIWILATDAASTTIKHWIHITIYEDTLAGIGYGILGVGCFMFFIGFCGCCGAIRESALMLAVINLFKVVCCRYVADEVLYHRHVKQGNALYIFFMAVLLLGEIAAVIYILVERSSIEDLVRDQLLTDVKNFNSTGKQSAIDFIQLELKCCGSDGYIDYQNYSAFFSDVHSQNIYVPDSCCKSSNNELPTIPKNSTQCQLEAKEHTLKTKQLFTTGCFYMLNDLIDENSAALIGFAAGIMVVAIIGIVFAVFLCRNRTEYDFYDDE